MLKPLIMALGLGCWKSFYDRYLDVTNLKMVNHQAHDHFSFEGVYSAAQILRKSSSKGIVQIELCIQIYTSSILVKFKFSVRTSIFRVA